jgi:hypothetical protein
MEDLNQLSSNMHQSLTLNLLKKKERLLQEVAGIKTLGKPKQIMQIHQWHS